MYCLHYTFPCYHATIWAILLCETVTITSNHTIKYHRIVCGCDESEFSLLRKNLNQHNCVHIRIVELRLFYFRFFVMSPHEKVKWNIPTKLTRNAMCVNQRHCCCYVFFFFLPNFDDRKYNNYIMSPCNCSALLSTETTWKSVDGIFMWLKTLWLWILALFSQHSTICWLFGQFLAIRFVKVL